MKRQTLIFRPHLTQGEFWGCVSQTKGSVDANLITKLAM